MFGDILPTRPPCCGARWFAASASIGRVENSLGHRAELYEPIHGSAPDIAGQNAANPLATILSRPAAPLLARASAGGDAVEAAVAHVLHDGYRTPDIVQPGTRPLGCREMGRRW